MGEALMEARLAVEQLKGGRKTERLSADVVIVGSGAGGAAAALRLSQAGKKVVVLEEGAHLQGGDFTQRPLHMTPRLYRDAGSQLTSNGAVTVLQGRAVGGSTTINMGDVSLVETPVLGHWQRRHGWETGIEDWRRHEAWALAEMEATPIRDDQVNANNRLVLDAAARMGWQGGVFDNFRKGCIGSGYCMAGCRYDAKRGVMLNLLPKAVALGARVYSGAKVTRVLMEGGKAVGVAGQVVSAPFHTEKGGFEVRAREVILSAGAIHSAGLLYRSGHRHPGLGKDITLQPQVPLIARFKDEIKGYRGIPQSVYVSQFDQATEEHGLGGYRFEPVFGQPETVAAGLMSVGREHLAFMTDYAHLAMTLINIPDRPTGHLEFLKDRTKIHYYPPQEYFDRARQALINMSMLYMEAGASSVVLPQPVGVFESGKIFTTEELAALPLPRLISAHPQGGCAMGADAGRHVLDLKGRVRGVKQLRVLDASSFPTSSAHHNTIPIVALASLLTEAG